MQLSLLALGVLALACAERATAPDAPPWPAGSALVAYTGPIWLPGDSLVGTNHTPLDSITVTTDGTAVYWFRDSLRGWWVIRTDGLAMRRAVSTTIADASRHPGGTRLAFIIQTGGVSAPATVPIMAGLPDLSAATVVLGGPHVILPHLNKTDDSLVCMMPFFRGAWVVATDGGGGHIASDSLQFPSWHPYEHKLLGVITRNDDLESGSRIVTMDLDTGATTTLVHSTTSTLEYPLYSPDASQVSYVQRPHAAGWSDGLWSIAVGSASPHRIINTPIYPPYAWNDAGTRIACVHYDSRDFTLDNGTVWLHDIALGTAMRIAGNR